MESVINRIIEIDKNATERINSASEKRNRLLKILKAVYGNKNQN